MTCQCAERTKPVRDRNWKIVSYKCVYFEVLDWVASAYSSLKCLSCGAEWRTNTNYVEKIRNRQKGLM